MWKTKKGLAYPHTDTTLQISNKQQLITLSFFGGDGGEEGGIYLHSYNLDIPNQTKPTRRPNLLLLLLLPCSQSCNSIIFSPPIPTHPFTTTSTQSPRPIGSPSRNWHLWRILPFFVWIARVRFHAWVGEQKTPGQLKLCSALMARGVSEWVRAGEAGIAEPTLLAQ